MTIWTGEFQIYDATGQLLNAGDTVLYRARGGHGLRLGKILEITYETTIEDTRYLLTSVPGVPLGTKVAPFPVHTLFFKIKGNDVDSVLRLEIADHHFVTSKVEVASRILGPEKPDSGRNRCWNCVRVVRDGSGKLYADYFT